MKSRLKVFCQKCFQFATGSCLVIKQVKFRTERIGTKHNLDARPPYSSLVESDTNLITRTFPWKRWEERGALSSSEKL